MKESLTKGFVNLTIARIIFVLCGFISNVFLGRFLGPEDYGIYGVVIAVNTAVVLFISKGFPSALAKFIAEEKYDIKDVKKKVFNMQMGFSMVVTILYFLLAKQISHLLNNPSMEPLLVISAISIPFYALVSHHSGYFNGIRSYFKQSFQLGFYAILKLVFIIVFVLITVSVSGAMWGFFVANSITAILGLFLVGRIEKCHNKKITNNKIIAFSYPLIVSSLIISIVPYINILMVQKFLTQAAVGYYNSATTIARSPVIIFATISVVIFPALSNAISKNNLHMIEKYLKESFRYLLIFLIPICFILAATAENLIEVIYGVAYLPGATALMILLFYIILSQMSVYLLTVIDARGETYFKLITSGISIIVLIILNLILIPKFGITGAAVSILLNSLLIFIILFKYLYNRYKFILDIKSGIRITAASLLVYFLATVSKDIALNFFTLTVTYAMLFLLYLLILFTIKEIRRDDIIRFKRLLPKSVHKYIPQRLWFFEEYL